MRRILATTGLATLAATAAIGAVTGTAGAAHRAADQGFAGGGYVINAALPGDKRARFDFAVRESQVDGSVRG